MKRTILLLLGASLLTGCVAIPAAGVAALAVKGVHDLMPSFHSATNTTQEKEKKKPAEPVAPIVGAPDKVDPVAQEALMENAFTVTPQLLEQRNMETRRYDGIQENALLAASADLLQDLGYAVDNTDTTLGVVSGSKDRDATDRREQVSNFFNKLLRRPQKPLSKDQTLHVSVVLKPVIGSNGQPISSTYLARVTFQRVLRKTDGSEVKETLRDPKLYQEFFQRLSKAIFLEGQVI